MNFTLARLRIIRFLREWRLRSDLPPDPDLEIEHDYVYNMVRAERIARRHSDRYFQRLFKYRREVYMRSLAEPPVRRLENVPTNKLAAAFGLDRKRFQNIIITLAPWAQAWGDEDIGKGED